MEFVKFKRAVHAQFNQLAAGADMLFLTNVDKDALWDCYLNSFSEEERQSHNCNNCKHYIRHYGRVVAIKDNKVVTMWENLQLDDCKNPEPVRGFFNEYLNSELTPHRKVFEVLADKMKTPYQEHQLSGLGFSSTMRNSVIVKVDGTFSRTLKVNF